MVFPKQAYFGQAYKATIPFHLRRVLQVKKPRSAYHVYSLVSDDVLWDLYVNNAIDIKELYFDFTSTPWHKGILIPTSDQLCHPKGSTGSTSPESVSSMSSPSECEDEKMELETLDSAASKKEEASVEGLVKVEIPTKNELKRIQALKDEPVAGPSGLQAPYKPCKRHMKKRKSELDYLYMDEEFQPDAEKRKLAWKGPPFKHLKKDETTDVDSDAELAKERAATMTVKVKEQIEAANEPQPSTSKACNNGSKTVAKTQIKTVNEPQPSTSKACNNGSKTVAKKKIEAANEPQPSTSKACNNGSKTVAKKQMEAANEPQPSTSKACNNGSKTVAKKQMEAAYEPQPSTSRACNNGSEKAVKDALFKRLSTIMHNFFSSMPGTDYRRPSMSLQTQLVDENGEKKWLCPVCKKEDLSENGDEMISCDKCGDWYHFACVGIKGEYQSKRRWYCKRCVFKALRGNKFEPAEFPLFE
ncbi:unnamed protein product [Orchesella dallaii]|uniref:PHD-type domain-containing protein n=1 Tax=Orchesella dallaii TaxID=48710 RepID=A0ABP1PVW2_9HEXA